MWWLYHYPPHQDQHHHQDSESDENDTATQQSRWETHYFLCNVEFFFDKLRQLDYDIDESDWESDTCVIFSFLPESNVIPCLHLFPLIPLCDHLYLGFPSSKIVTQVNILYSECCGKFPLCLVNKSNKKFDKPKILDWLELTGAASTVTWCLTDLENISVRQNAKERQGNIDGGSTAIWIA